MSILVKNVKISWTWSLLNGTYTFTIIYQSKKNKTKKPLQVLSPVTLSRCPQEEGLAPPADWTTANTSSSCRQSRCPTASWLRRVKPNWRAVTVKSTARKSCGSSPSSRHIISPWSASNPRQTLSSWKMWWESVSVPFQKKKDPKLHVLLWIIGILPPFHFFKKPPKPQETDW